MNCKEIKDLISSYIDGDLNEELQKEVKHHLTTCNQCKQLEVSLSRLVIKPLKKAEKIKAPEAVWYQIKTVIEEKPKKGFLPYVIDSLFSSFLARKPVFAVVTIMVLILIGVALIERVPFNGKEAVNTYLEEQIQFISYLEGDERISYSDIDDVELGTTIEKYLL